METFLAIISILIYAELVYTIPPPQCFANFRWDDCGKPPEPKMYYWKPGSRCEVGIWRGCLPNLNMFKDEYECVSTCVFTVRALPSDFHQLNAEDEEMETTTDFPTTMDDSTGATDGLNGTDSTDAGGANSTGTGGEGGATDAAGGDQTGETVAETSADN